MQQEDSGVQTQNGETTRTDGENFYRVKIIHSSETGVYSFQHDKTLEKRAKVIVPTKYGSDCGIVLGILKDTSSVHTDEVQEIERLATDEDVRKIEENKSREQKALEICQEKVDHHRLDMKLVSAHYLLEEPKVLFFFTADQRVDFRALVKDLVATFKMRIELRQIGVRDESRVLGGLGVCGRFLCCHNVTDKLNPVSIKMAKEQNLSLNSMKISGPCGRLLCCLSYEYDFYCEEKRCFPAEGSRIHYKQYTFKISEVNILSKTIRLTGNGGQTFDIPVENFSYDRDKNRWSVDLKEYL